MFVATTTGVLQKLYALRGTELNIRQQQALIQLAEALGMDKEIEDLEYFEFLKKLDASSFEVTDWEAKFIESVAKQKSLTIKQHEIIRGLERKYKAKLFLG
jgi:hypothetical protein